MNSHVAHIGVDPGISGGLCLVIESGFVDARKMPATPVEIAALMREFRGIVRTRCGDVPNNRIAATIEHVWSMPGQGHVGPFTFGKSYGILLGVIAAFGFDLRGVVPRVWQDAMQCRTGGQKNISKARAQQLFPDVKMSHAIADACLIAEYSRLFRK